MVCNVKVSDEGTISDQNFALMELFKGTNFHCFWNLLGLAVSMKATFLCSKATMLVPIKMQPSNGVIKTSVVRRDGNGSHRKRRCLTQTTWILFSSQQFTIDTESCWQNTETMLQHAIPYGKQHKKFGKNLTRHQLHAAPFLCIPLPSEWLSLRAQKNICDKKFHCERRKDYINTARVIKKGATATDV